MLDARLIVQGSWLKPHGSWPKRPSLAKAGKFKESALMLAHSRAVSAGLAREGRAKGAAPDPGSGLARLSLEP